MYDSWLPTECIELCGPSSIPADPIDKAGLGMLRGITKPRFILAIVTLTVLALLAISATDATAGASRKLPKKVSTLALHLDDAVGGVSEQRMAGSRQEAASQPVLAHQAQQSQQRLRSPCARAHAASKRPRGWAGRARFGVGRGGSLAQGRWCPFRPQGLTRVDAMRISPST